MTQKYFPEIMSRNKALHFLGIGHEKLERWIELGLKVTLIDGKAYYTQKAIRDFLEKHEV